MDLKAKIEQAKKDIVSDDWETRMAASDFLSENGTPEVKGFLISLLSSSEQLTRDAAALAIREIGDNNAINPLLTAIFKKENIHNNGTLVYALQTLDCSKKLKELFEILFYHDYEAQVMADMILDKQEFEFTKQDILDIEAEWEGIKIHSEKCPNYGDSKETIQSSIDGFLTYLER